MTPNDAIKVFSELRDLQVFDCDDHLCGVCDDLELDGRPGRPLKVKALLVGPGAYDGRLPGPVFWLVRRLAGQGIVRVPWSAVAHVTSRISLNRRAEDLGLDRPERRLRPLIQKVPFA
jgi:sporulation protein YlmC with PRC-barrel domain